MVIGLQTVPVSSMYNSIFEQWIPGTPGHPNVQEFPTFEVEGGDEIILH